ncbi:MAG: hypothetical protein PHV59_01160 [Victivallales bacterium]|nr:hypothetical protein [Victivallales bacterium]
MDKELVEKMDMLFARIEREDKRASASFVTSIICRILITLLISCSLTYILITFKNRATPENMAIVINEQVRDSIPRVRSELHAQIPAQADQMADNTIKAFSNLIPVLGELAAKQLEIRFDQIMDHYKVQREKIFEHICSKVIDKIKKDKDITKDKTLASVLAAQLADECDREIRDIINNAFFDEIDALQAQVEKLRQTPDNKMTRVDAAKKNLITCWIYLVDNKEIEEEGIIGCTASFLGKAAEDFLASQK